MMKSLGLAACAALYVWGGQAEAAPANPPDVVMQVFACLPANDPGLADITRYLNASLQSLKAQQPAIFPNPTDQVACVSGHETIGVWFAHTSAPSDLAGQDILSAHGSAFAVRMTPSAANVLVGRVWSKYQADNAASGRKFGGYDIDYQTATSQVKVTLHISQKIFGKVDGNVTIGFLDTLSTPGNMPACTTSRSYDYDTNTAGALLHFFMPLPASGFVTNDINSQFAAGGAAVWGDTDPGLGCMFASFLPTVILTPASDGAAPGKIVFSYDNISVSSKDGLWAYSANLPKPQGRNPGIIQDPPFDASVFSPNASGTVISTTLAVAVADLRQDPNTPIRLTWTPLEGHLVSTGSNGMSAVMSFASKPFAGHSEGDKVKIGSVKISATDADNVSASNTFAVYATIKPPPTDTQPKDDKKPFMKP